MLFYWNAQKSCQYKFIFLNFSKRIKRVHLRNYVGTYFKPVKNLKRFFIINLIKTNYYLLQWPLFRVNYRNKRNNIITSWLTKLVTIDITSTTSTLTSATGKRHFTCILWTYFTQFVSSRYRAVTKNYTRRSIILPRSILISAKKQPSFSVTSRWTTSYFFYIS